MKKAVTAALLAVLVCGVGIAGAAGSGKTRTVHKLCVNVEQRTDYPSYGDLNLYRGDKRVCLVGPRGKAGAKGKHGARGQDGAPGADGAVGAQGPVGPMGRQGEKGEQGWQGVPGRDGIGYGCNGQPVDPENPAQCPGRPGDTGPAGPTGPEGPVGPTGPAGQNGLGDGTATLCVSNGENVKYGGQDGELCDPGHDLILHVVIVTDN